jgi:hypothetical protein
MRTFRARLRRYHERDGTRIVFGRYETHISILGVPVAFVQDLESYARDIGVLHPDEIVDSTPRCSRCKSRVPERRTQLARTHTGDLMWTDTGDFMRIPVEPPRYHRQCERCIVWSRASRRDPTKCLDCRHLLDPHVLPQYRTRRCERCRDAKLNREYRARQIEGATNPNSPWFGAPMGQAYDR